MFRIKIESHVVRFLKKLGKKERDYFYERFEKLSRDKTGYRLLDVSKNIELWELRCSAHRVYYTVEHGMIIIEDIEYEGDIYISDYSHKDDQQQVINKLKRKIRK